MARGLDQLVCDSHTMACLHSCMCLQLELDAINRIVTIKKEDVMGKVGQPNVAGRGGAGYGFTPGGPRSQGGYGFVPGGVPRTPAHVTATPMHPSMGGSTPMHPSMGGGRVSLLAGLRYCCALGADRCLGDPPPQTHPHPPTVGRRFVLQILIMRLISGNMPCMH